MIENDERLLEPAPAPPAAESGPMTYGDYLRVPELTALQSPLSSPEAHDELLFIIVQQAQELWFKQLLHELRAVIGSLAADDLHDSLVGCIRLALMWPVDHHRRGRRAVAHPGVDARPATVTTRLARKLSATPPRSVRTLLRCARAPGTLPKPRERWPSG